MYDISKKIKQLPNYIHNIWNDIYKFANQSKGVGTNLSYTMNSDGVLHIQAKAGTYGPFGNGGLICNIIDRQQSTNFGIQNYLVPGHKYAIRFNILDKNAELLKKVSMSFYQYNSTDSDFKTYNNYHTTMMEENIIEDLSSIIFRIDVSNITIDEDFEFDARPIIYDITNEYAITKNNDFRTYITLPDSSYDINTTDENDQIIVDVDKIISPGVYLLTNPGYHYINLPNDFSPTTEAYWLFVYASSNHVLQRIRYFSTTKYSDRILCWIDVTNKAITKTAWSNSLDYNSLVTKSDLEALNLNSNISKIFNNDIYWFKIIKPLYNVANNETFEIIDGEYTANGINLTIANSTKFKSGYINLDGVTRLIDNGYLDANNFSKYFVAANKYTEIRRAQYSSDINIIEDDKYFKFYISKPALQEVEIIITNIPKIVDFDFQYIFDHIADYELFKKYIVKSNSYNIFDPYKENSHKYYRRYKAYDVVSCDSTEDGYYRVSYDDSTNYINPHIEYIEDENIRTYFVPIIKENKYIQLYIVNDYMKDNIIFFDSNKDPITFTTVTPAASTTNLYWGILPDELLNIAYFGYIEDKTVMNYDNLIAKFCVSAPDKIVLSPGSALNLENELIFNGSKIINKTPCYNIDYSKIANKMAATWNSYNYYFNTSTSQACTEPMFLPKGTIITTSYNIGLSFSIRGCTYNGSYYSGEYNPQNGKNKLIVPEDFYGSIDIYKVNWKFNSGKYAMNNLSLQELMQLICIISPEDQINNPWLNKKWYSYGTSISDISVDASNNFRGTAASSTDGPSGKWPLYLDLVSGMIRYNGAIGSGGIMNKDENNGALNVKRNILSTPADADLVTLEILPNDPYYTESSLGTIDDTDNSTIMGNLNQCLDYLVNNTHAKIAFVFIGSVASNRTTDDKKMYDSLSSTRKTYRNAVNLIKQLAELYGCYVIDADANAWAYEQRGWGNLMADWIHPSYLGGWILGRYIWNQIKLIAPPLKWPTPTVEQTQSTMEWSEYTTPQE